MVSISSLFLFYHWIIVHCRDMYQFWGDTQMINKHMKRCSTPFIIFVLSIHQLIGIWDVSIFWLLSIVLLWTFTYKFLTPVSILYCTYLKVELLGHLLILLLLLLLLLCHMTCGILVPQPGMEIASSAVKAQSPNHWAPREFPTANSTVNSLRNLWTGFHGGGCTILHSHSIA